jgi:ribosome assembly protein YihI (activator of Der GTPase)
MPRQKKSRKIGQIGTPSAPKAKRVSKVSDRKAKKTLGKPAGSRNNQENTHDNKSGSRALKDPRLGSKKPVPLIAKEKPATPAPAKIKHFSPAQELNSIEKDQRLMDLLEKSDAGEPLSREDTHYADSKMARHKELCELLGIVDEPQEDEKPQPEQDLYSQFESININQFKE